MASFQLNLIDFYYCISTEKRYSSRSIPQDISRIKMIDCKKQKARLVNYTAARKTYGAFQLALTVAKVESGGFFSHSLYALYRGWLIICSSHMLTHDLLLSFSGPVSWDISCFHQPLSFVQQQLACHLAATLLWMCPPFACSCCTGARQSVHHSVLHLFKALLSEFLHMQGFILCLGSFSSCSDRRALLGPCSGASCTQAKSGLVWLPNSSHCVWLLHFVHVPPCSECLIVVCSISPTCWAWLVQRLQAVCTVYNRTREQSKQSH